jgi:DNA helicase-2/ATP-dependent DNA helicase PcrA
MLLTPLIEKLTNERQQEAVREYKRCVVLAGPGTGKTHTLVLKLAHLLGQTVKEPHSIACITYMNEAVREIENRLSQIVKCDPVSGQ